ncbi:MAG: c-type cytochrome, partial [Planctomycetales bacterium]|nr:c-type cytochrome [Planctomycetales bacterium]
FTIGGRRTQSGLYRVTYTGEESTSPAEKIEASSEVAKLRDARHKLESFHGEPQAGAIEAAWPYLGHEDRFLRFAARIAVEHQPLKQWQSKALSEQDPRALITAMVALARVAGAQHPDEAGARELQSKIVEALGRVDWQSLDEQGRLELLRAYGLAFTRLGSPSAEIKKTVAERFAPLFPSQSQFVDRELCQLLVYVEAPGVVAKTLDLLDKAPTQEQQIHYAFCLRGLESGWTLDQRRRYFNWFNQAAAHRGGMSFGGFLANIRNAAIQTLSADEKAALAETLAAPPEKIDPAEAIQREFVQKWTVDELLPHVDDQLTGRNFERGREIFGAALCFKCHRFANDGGIIGPDLTGVGRRFNSRSIVESLIEPSRVISDQYQATQFLTDAGQTVVGRIVNLNGDNIMIITNMLDPSSQTQLKRGQIELMRPSPLSMMPEGLLDRFTKEEILDLIAYLRSGGDPNAPEFAAAGK